MPFKLPAMRCDLRCGECCGIVPAIESEYRKVEAFVRDRGIEIRNQGITCPFYQKGRCATYPVRPLACRLFGHSEKMTCPRGYNVDIPERKIRRAIRRRGYPTKVLHEMLGPDWKELMGLSDGSCTVLHGGIDEGAPAQDAPCLVRESLQLEGPPSGIRGRKEVRHGARQGTGRAYRPVGGHGREPAKGRM